MRQIPLLLFSVMTISLQADDSLELPDPLRTVDGRTVETAAQWMEEQRPWLLDLFRSQVYGKAPGPPDDWTATVLEESREALEGRAIRRQVRIDLRQGHRVLSADLLLYLPPEAAGQRVPVFLLLNFGGNHTVQADPEILLTRSMVRGSYAPATEKRGFRATRYPVDSILERGYGLATAYCGDFDPDFHDGFTNGVHALFDSPDGRTGDSWGTVSAWAWGLSRVMDYLETDPLVDAGRVALLGHSRLGKTALWAGAQDERFAMVISNNSGCTGAALARRKAGERVTAINRTFPHWFCENYRHYNDREEALPVDQHMLVALAAPRPVYVASATEDQWADPEGEFLAAVHASPVYALFGLPGLEGAAFPEPDQPLQDGHIGYHLREGRHDLTAFDWEAYLDFADRHGLSQP